MADNVEADAGAGGATFKTDDIAGVHVPYTKLMDGTADSSEVIGGDAANGLDVDVTRSALPSGAATSAKQDTMIGHLDGVEGLLTTIDGDTGTLAVVGGGTEATALRVTVASDSTGVLSVDDNGASLTVDNAHLTSLGGAISGTEVQVDVVGALPAGTNAIGKLAANSGVDIGDVDILSIAAGDNNIGNVDVASIAAGDNNIGNVDVVTLPALAAGTNLVGRVSSSDETSTVYQGTTARTPAFAIIDAATSGDNTLLAAQGSGNIIRVLALYLVSAGTVNVRFESGASGTALSGQMNLVANTGFVLPYNPVGWFQTAANTLLNLELSGNVSVDGGFTYIVVT